MIRTAQALIMLLFLSMPLLTPAVAAIKTVDTGNSHTIVLKDDGTVWAWGHNEWGALGTGDTAHSYTPVSVSGLSGVTAISAGGYFGLALKSDRTVWAWGDTGFGSPGIRTTPFQITGLSNVIAIATGNYHSLALKSDGTVWAWGNNGSGQLGDNSYSASGPPFRCTGCPMSRPSPPAPPIPWPS